MAQSGVKQLTIERTVRGYRQDLENVMGSDPIRAIVELVTNSDDAYLDTPSSRRKKMKIRIEVERHRKGETIVWVKDRAKGMSPDEMELKLTKEGRRTSGFEEGADRRGLFGRGAKDIVHFGQVTFESQKDGKHGSLTLLYDHAPTQRAVLEELATSSSFRGTTVKLAVQPQFSFRTHDRLRDDLSRHFALRPILMDSTHRDVSLVDLNQDRGDPLTYKLPKAKQIARANEVELLDYPGERLKIDLYESEESLDDGEPREYWRHSLLLRSGRASYEIFEGKFRKEPWANYLGRLYGFVDVPGINRLIRQYDDLIEKGESPPASNPIRLVKRDRSGLVGRDEHPFVDALYRTIEDYLTPHLERIRDAVERSQESPVGSDLQKRLRDLGSLLSRLMQEEDAGDGIEGTSGSLPPLGLTVFPSLRIAEPHEPASVLVRFRPTDDEQLSAVTVLVAIEEDSGDSRKEELALVDRGSYWSRAFQVAGRPEGAITELSFEVRGQSQSCLVEWKHRSIAPVERLQFEHASYVIKDGGRRNVKLLASWDSVLTSELPGKQLSGSPNIFLAPEDWAFGYDEHRACAAYVLGLRGRGVGSKARLEATLNGERAECELSVTAAGAEGITVKIKEFEISQRSFMSGDGATLNVNAKDKSIARYLGPKRLGWPGQDELHFRTMLAEIIAFTYSRFRIQKKRQDEKQSASELFIAHTRLMERWLPRIHAVLVPVADLPRLGNRQIVS